MISLARFRDLKEGAYCILHRMCRRRKAHAPRDTLAGSMHQGWSKGLTIAHACLLETKCMTPRAVLATVHPLSMGEPRQATFEA